MLVSLSQKTDNNKRSKYNNRSALNFLIAVIISSVCVFSCSGSAKADWAIGRKIARDARNQCISPDCSPSVGSLVSVDKENYFQCTFTLVAPNVVATNAHCIPADLQQAGANCVNRVYLHFAPSITHPDYESSASCESVLMANGANAPDDDDGNPVPDYAFLKINKVQNRPYIKMNRTGFANNERYFLDVVDPFSRNKNLISRQRSVSCRAIQHSLILKSFTDQFASVVILSDCDGPVIHGNSGTAVRDAKGEIHGLFYAFTDQGNKRDILKTYSEKGIIIPKELPNYLFVVNLACLGFPNELLAPISQQCADKKPPNSTVLSMQEDLTKLMNDTTGDERYSAPGYKWFQWKLTNRDDRLYYAPTCLRTAVASFDLEAPTALQDFQVQTVLDKFGRFQENRLVPVPGPPQTAFVNPERLFEFKLKVGGRIYVVKSCKM